MAFCHSPGHVHRCQLCESRFDQPTSSHSNHKLGTQLEETLVNQMYTNRCPLNISGLWPSSTLRTKAHSVKSSGAMLAAAIASARPRASAHMPALAQALIAVLYVTKLGTTWLSDSAATREAKLGA